MWSWEVQKEFSLKGEGAVSLPSTETKAQRFKRLHLSVRHCSATVASKVLEISLKMLTLELKVFPWLDYRWWQRRQGAQILSTSSYLSWLMLFKVDSSRKIILLLAGWILLFIQSWLLTFADCTKYTFVLMLSLYVSYYV